MRRSSTKKKSTVQLSSSCSTGTRCNNTLYGGPEGVSTYEIVTAVQRPRYCTGLPRVQKSTQPKLYMTALPARSSTKFSPDHSY